MSATDDRGTPPELHPDRETPARPDAGAAESYGQPGRGEEGLDTAAAEAGSPSRGEGLTDDELVEMVSDPDHQA